MGGCLCKRKRSSLGHNRDRRRCCGVNNSRRDECNNAIQQVARRLTSRTQVVTLAAQAPSSQGVDGNHIFEDPSFYVHTVIKVCHIFDLC